MFWRMTVVADDHGRFEADPRILLSRCFPLKAQIVKLKQIEQWFTELVACGLVLSYAVNGKQYGLFITWGKHQRIRAKESKYPSPSLADIGGNPPQMSSARARVEESRNRGVEESNNTSPPNWGSPEALVESYNRLTPDDCPAIEILSAGRRAKARAYLKLWPEQSWWERVFQEIHVSKFLRGKKNTPGHEHFVADLDWLLMKGKDGVENALKTFEGKYRDE